MATASTAEGRGAEGKGGRAPSAWQAIGDVAKVLDSNYRKHTPTRLRMLDMFLVFVFSTGVLQVRMWATVFSAVFFAMQSGVLIRQQRCFGCMCLVWTVQDAVVYVYTIAIFFS